ncbi:MAG: hypothetical protein ACI9MR_001850 [Myxococcota bacterium]|jgi:hypothetical protein
MHRYTSRLPALKRPFRALLSAAFVATIGFGGVCPQDPGPSPCAGDRLGCQGDPTDFTYLTQCELTGDLQVEAGFGEQSYSPLAGESGPEIFFGFQGGQHTYLAFRVTNAALDRYDQLRITVWMAQGESCVAGEPNATIPTSCSRELGLRQIVIGGADSTLLTNPDDGAVEEYGVVLILSSPIAGEKTVVSVEIEDPCGRTGSASFDYIQ